MRQSLAKLPLIIFQQSLEDDLVSGLPKDILSQCLCGLEVFPKTPKTPKDNSHVFLISGDVGFTVRITRSWQAAHPLEELGSIRVPVLVPL